MRVSLALPLRDRLRDRAGMVPVPWRGPTSRESRAVKMVEEKVWWRDQHTLAGRWISGV